MSKSSALSAAQLYRTCDPAQFPFETTATLAQSDGLVGQERAAEAVRFGIGIRQAGFNLFAVGPGGVGKHQLVEEYLQTQATARPTPDDWVYLHNFGAERQPHALRLPAGRGRQFAKDVAELVDALRQVIPSAFESDDYHEQQQAVSEALQQQQEAALEALQSSARERNIALLRTPAGLAFAPLRDGEVMAPQEFETLPTEEQRRVEQDVEELQKELQRILSQVPQLSRQRHERLKALNREVANYAVQPLIAELRQQYQDLPTVLAHLDALQADVAENVDAFLGGGEQNPMAQGGSDGAGRSPAGAGFLRRYAVNLVVDHADTSGAPIVSVDNPTFQNLLGRIEHMQNMGALFTDFTLIKPGALHQANGGYLLIDVRQLLQHSYAWEGLKRALKSAQLRLESLGQSLGLINTVTLEPEPIPLDLKVILLGDPLFYYLLHRHDPEFAELFKVAADFDDRTDRTAAANLAYAALMRSVVDSDGLRHLDRGAVARVIEHSARMAGDAEKLSTRVRAIGDLLREADYWAGEAQSTLITAPHVAQAIAAQVRRSSRIQERMQEAVLRETVLIDTSGSRVGQINGLAVLQVGEYAFGSPSRISATVRRGKGEVIDIERQVEMGGPLHSKGVLILSGFLGSRFGREEPLSLSASLVFEQNYGGVDGDSASSAELYALLSALAEVGLRQSLAVTGSVNQHGTVQAIGGVNEKIEGFFDVCQARGLSGEQGVLIPAANVKHLMLRADVVEAVAAGRFHVHAVAHVDEGIALLTGLPAGSPAADGSYPEGSINQRILSRLESLARKDREKRAAARGDAHE
jgi:lon-related putative ATP-dependent protease